MMAKPARTFSVDTNAYKTQGRVQGAVGMAAVIAILYVLLSKKEPPSGG